MKSMKKALSLFLALSMLMTVCAVNILAEDTVTLTVPNGNFANVTVPLTEGGSNENGTLPDGWILKKYSINAEEPSENRLCYSIGTYLDGTIKTSPTSDRGPEDGSKSLMIKNMAGNFLVFESPKIPLKGALTENAEFTVAFDYWLSKGNYKAAIFFYNTEGQVYKGRETGWGAEVISPKAHTDLEYQDAKGNNSYVNEARAAAGWQTKSFTAVAPEGTSSVSIGLFAVNNSAVRYFYDNVKLSYKSFSAMSGPQAVTNLKASAGDKQVTLSWELPADTTNYAGVKIAVKNGATPVKEVFVEDAAKTSETIPQLENGVDYTFEVYAMNADKSKFSEPVSVNATPAASSSSEGGVVIIPNGDFEKTAAVNSALPDGWSYQIYVQPDAVLDPAQLYYLIGSDRGNGASAAGSNSLVMKCPGLNEKLGYNKPAMMVMSPVVPLERELTEPQEFTYTFDYNAIRYNANTAILFFNAEGKIYNGTEWIDWTVKTDDDWKFTDSSGQKGWFSTNNGTAATGWQKGEIVTDAPVGTAGVRVVAVVTGGAANLCAFDNLNVTYGGQLPEITVPNPVTNLKAVSGDKQVTLSWDLPEDTANYAGVKITVKSGSSAVTTLYAEGKEATSKIVNGLTNGTPYTFEVQSMNADKSEFAEAVSVTAVPHVAGVLPVKNPLSDKTIFADDYEMSIDLNIVSEGEKPSDAAQLAYYNSVVDAINVFESQGKILTFTSDTPGVSFRETKYKLGVAPDGAKVHPVIKQQLVYQPSQITSEPITVNVTAADSEGSSTTVSFKLTVAAPPESEKPVDDPNSKTAQLYVPNPDFDRTAELLPYNKDLSGGWHPVLWGAEGCLGDNQLSYKGVATNDGNGLDLKAPSGGGTSLMIQSAFLKTPDTQERAYTLSLVYKCANSVQRPNFSLFFFNEKKEGFIGFDPDGAAIWKADPTPADLWASVDAEGKAPYENAGSTNGFQQFSLTRTAPEGTAYVMIGLNATFGSAYRYQVDNIRLSYLKNKAPVINGENPLSRTLSLGEALRLDLNGIFSEPDGETMTFTAETGKGVIENGVYTYIPNKIGEETVLVTAADEQGAKARLRIAVTVKDATSVSVPNKDIKPVTRETVQGSMELKKADGSNVTSLSQLNAGETLKINVSLKNTSELPVTTTLLIVKYDANGVVESVTTKGIVIPSTGGDPDYTTVRDYVVENNSGSVEVMLWDSATNLNSLIDPIRI